MSLAKPAFSTAFVAFHAVTFALSLFGIAGGATLAWWGVALVSGAALFEIFAVLVVEPPARRASPSALWVAISGALMATYASATAAPSGEAAGVLAVVGLATLLVYWLWLVRMDPRPSPLLALGARLPPFELTGLGGERVGEKDLRGGPSVIIFHRGGYSPRCLRQVASFASFAPSFQALGARLWVVSADSRADTAQLAQRLRGVAECLIDEGNRAARALGIEHPTGGPLGISLLGYPASSARPTVLVTDARGALRFYEVYEDARRRTPPGRALAALAGAVPHGP